MDLIASSDIETHGSNRRQAPFQSLECLSRCLSSGFVSVRHTCDHAGLAKRAAADMHISAPSLVRMASSEVQSRPPIRMVPCNTPLPLTLHDAVRPAAGLPVQPTV